LCDGLSADGNITPQRRKKERKKDIAQGLMGSLAA